MGITAICFGTYNRLPMLTRCLASIRRAAGNLDVKCYIADGGSTDGSIEYLSNQPDVCLIEQGELLGAVRAFNACYERAIDEAAEYLCTFNDDIEFDGHGAPELMHAVQRLQLDEALGAIAFASDRFRTPPEVASDPFACQFLPGGQPITFRVELYHGRPYMNQGLAKRAAHMAVARAQGDPTGRDYWDPTYRTYGADSASGMWMWRLGWRIDAADDLRVHEHLISFIDPFSEMAEGGELDPLRIRNGAEMEAVLQRFHATWDDPAAVAYNRADAERFGGRLVTSMGGCG